MASTNMSVNDFGSLSFGDSQCRGRLTEIFTKVAINLLGFFLIAGFCNALHYILRPFSQPRITSDIFVGLIIGNLGFVHRAVNKSTAKTLRFIVDFGMICYMFVLGIEMDPYTIFKIPSKDAKVAYAGMVSTFILACAITPFMHYTDRFGMDFTLSLSTMLASTASPVLTRLITSLKIGKSDIGRLVIAAGMHSDFISTLVISLGYIIYPFTSKDEEEGKHVSPDAFSRFRATILMGCALLFQAVVAATLSPIFINWVNNENPEGKPMKGSHLVLSVAFMILICCCSPVYGYNPILSAFMAGIFLPREGRVSRWVVSKINYLLSTIFYPIFFFWMGYEANLGEFELGSLMTWARLFVLFGIATIGKVSGTVISGAMLGFNWPESVALGLLLTAKGHFHIYLAIATNTAGKTSTSTSTVMIIGIFFTVVYVPSIVAQIIKRARKRAPTHRMALQLLDPANELRILLCLHGPQNVPSTINFMEISRGIANPGIVVYVTDMIELTNEIAATLVKGDGPDTVTVTDKAVVEMRNQVTAAVEAYVDQDSDGIMLRRMLALSTFSGLPQDVCILAEDLMVALIILPFHKSLHADGTLDGGHSGFRYVNRKVLRNAPCSVGILVDRGFRLLGKTSTSYASLNVAVIFIGGKDDREALAYAGRVARHPGVRLTVIRFLVDTNSDNASRRAAGNYRINISEQEEETNLDDECFAGFYERHVGGGHVSYLEKHLANSAETYSTLRSFEGQYSLVIVGRSGRVNSVLTFGMSDWQQCPELGPIGDVLSGSEFSATTSVLIIQQHNLRGELDGLDDDFSIM
ncbi:cation/H(+) antiporter 28 [Morus notabilis]|uniref:cation/H(+) antiporter 28 n=1 Tax=Morus notabilis TaxID=981085 RepID=UPI000CECF34C|nr:cation/H(+) antiporter 28 [Morus notabilis]